jgi:hypothetical protein
VVRRAIDDNNLPAKVRSFMGDGHTDKELAVFHVLNLEGILLDT